MLRGQNLAAIIASAKAATEDQRKAIALALANDAANDPGFVTQIQQAVANAGLPELSKALHVGLTGCEPEVSEPSSRQSRFDYRTSTSS